MPVTTSEGIPVRQKVPKRTYFVPTPLAADGTLLNPPPTPQHLPKTSSLLGHGINGGSDLKPVKSKVYKAVMQIINLRARGATAAQIGTQLGLTKDTVRTYLQRGIARGWIQINDFDDPEDKTAFVLKDKAVRNLALALDERTKAGVMTDRASDVALEVAKGTGLLKQHQITRGDGDHGHGVALQVNVVMPPDHANAMTSLRAGSIGGTPTIDADVLGE